MIFTAGAFLVSLRETYHDNKKKRNTFQIKSNLHKLFAFDETLVPEDRYTDCPIAMFIICFINKLWISISLTQFA